MKTYRKPMVESGVGCLCFFRGVGLHVRGEDDKGTKGKCCRLLRAIAFCCEAEVRRGDRLECMGATTPVVAYWDGRCSARQRASRGRGLVGSS
jgi:hypothetical protein